MKLFEVEAKCGHVGRNYYTIKVFPVKAENGKEAATIVRNIPRVKHNHKDAIRRVVEISFDRYLELAMINKSDPYFYCENVQDQKRFACSCVIYSEERFDEYEKEPLKKPVYVGKVLIRKPKRYYNKYLFNTMRYAI